MTDDFFKEILADHEIEPLAEIEPAPEVDYKPAPRIQTPHKPNSDHATFTVGTWEWQPPRSWIRIALPHPRYPPPGAIATDEIARAYDADCSLALEAEIVLRQYLWFVALKHKQPSFFEVGIDSHESLANERIAWLKGVWTSRNIRCPEPHEFIAMAIEPHPKLET